jgi:hypothetical protein
MLIARHKISVRKNPQKMFDKFIRPLCSKESLKMFDKFIRPLCSKESQKNVRQIYSTAVFEKKSDDSNNFRLILKTNVRHLLKGAKQVFLFSIRRGVNLCICRYIGALGG